MLAKDKKKHFWAGLASAILVGPFLIRLIAILWPRIAFVPVPLFSLALSAIAGAAKELIWDLWWKRGTPEFLDFWATVLGGFLGFMILNLVG